MTPVWWMAGGSAAVWLAASAAAAWLGRPIHLELLAGLAGPLMAAAATWVIVVRTFAADPARLTGVMIAGFAAKMVFFGVYVLVALRVLDLRFTPFVVSFTGYFIGLHLFEARCLQRLFAAAPRAGGGDAGA